MVPGGGFEPPTRGFSIRCSTPELPGHLGYASKARGLYNWLLACCPSPSALNLTFFLVVQESVCFAGGFSLFLRPQSLANRSNFGRRFDQVLRNAIGNHRSASERGI